MEVGMAQPRTADLYDDLTRAGGGRVDLTELGPTVPLSDPE